MDAPAAAMAGASSPWGWGRLPLRSVLMSTTSVPRVKGCRSLLVGAPSHGLLCHSVVAHLPPALAPGRCSAPGSYARIVRSADPF